MTAFINSDIGSISGMVAGVISGGLIGFIFIIQWLGR